MDEIDGVVREALRRATNGTCLFGGEAAQHVGRELWNADTSPQTHAVVECSDTAEVQRMVRIAADHDLSMAVLAGGHDWAGRASAVNGITLDLRTMNDVEYDPVGGMATIGGGALIDDVLQGVPDDRAVVAGTISTVGMTGLTMGGGYGKLNSRFGLALDNMVRAEVVLADGTVAVASAQDDAELFWALRGGGGNFGIVTSITMVAHALPKVLTGLFFVPLASAGRGLRGMQSILDDNGDSLSIFSALMTAPSGDRGLILAPLWSGEAAEGERVTQSIAGLPDAHTIAQGWSSYRGTYSKEFEAGWPKGRAYRMDAVNLARLDEATTEALVECASSLPGDADCIMLHDFHGACARVASDATAFPLRDEHFNVQLLAGWTKGEDARAGRAWIEAARSALVPLGRQGGYPNILGPDPEARSQARTFYGEAVERLKGAKQRYDPADLFRSNTGRF